VNKSTYLFYSQKQGGDFKLLCFRQAIYKQKAGLMHAQCLVRRRL